jgi:tetrahydromethanopterin S-methyltransferase subunit C
MKGATMQTSAQRPAVDIAPRTARPGLALLLALLSVPGSTIAWDLPAGGLWIGLPLAVAAIVLGLRARREGAGRRMATAAIVIGALALAQMAVYSIASALS